MRGAISSADPEGGLQDDVRTSSIIPEDGPRTGLVLGSIREKAPHHVKSRSD